MGRTVQQKQKKKESQTLQADWLTSSSGEKAIDYQRAAQITWWSILQGISVATLCEKIPGGISLIIENHQWYLGVYIIVSFMVVVNAWIQMTWAILIYRWPINLSHTALILLLGMSTQIMCLYVETPALWCLGVFTVTLSALVIYSYNIRNRVLIDLPISQTKRTIAIYIGFSLIALASSWYMLSYPPTDIQSFAFSLVFLLAVAYSWKVQNSNMKAEREIRNIP